LFSFSGHKNSTIIYSHAYLSKDAVGLAKSIVNGNYKCTMDQELQTACYNYNSTYSNGWQHFISRKAKAEIQYKIQSKYNRKVYEVM